MIGIVLLTIAITISAIVVSVIALHNLSQFKRRTIDDVAEFVHPLEENVSQELFDPQVDDALRVLRVPVNFRRAQRSRFDLAGTHYRYQHQRVRVLLQWANTEWYDMRTLATENEYSEQALRDLRTMRQKGKRFCRLVLVLRLKIWAWRVVMAIDQSRLLRTPRLSAYRTVGLVDMLELYQDIKLAAAGFALTYGEEESQNLLAAL